MENAIKFLRIQNFKSIKDVTLHPRRVNLVISEPNASKPNRARRASCWAWSIRIRSLPT